MGFRVVNISEEIDSRKAESECFKECWEKSRDEYRLIGEMIGLRKQHKITQGQLADMIGNKQQVISRIEKKGNSPSLGLFCSILNAMGYELKIVKRKLGQ